MKRRVRKEGEDSFFFFFFFFFFSMQGLLLVSMIMLTVLLISHAEYFLQPSIGDRPCCVCRLIDCSLFESLSVVLAMGTRGIG